MTVPGQKELKATADVDDNVREAVVEPVQEEKQESVTAQAAPCATEDIAEPEPADEELNRIVGIFKLAREQGYTLKLKQTKFPRSAWLCYEIVHRNWTSVNVN